MPRSYREILDDMRACTEHSFCDIEAGYWGEHCRLALEMYRGNVQAMVNHFAMEMIEGGAPVFDVLEALRVAYHLKAA